MGPHKRAAFKGGDSKDFMLINAVDKEELFSMVVEYMNAHPELKDFYKEKVGQDFTDNIGTVKNDISDLKDEDEDAYYELVERFNKCFE